MEDLTRAFVLCSFTVVLVLLIYVLLWITPIAVISEAKCLEKGFPRSKVTYTGKAYCLNLDGSVTVRVEEVK